MLGLIVLLFAGCASHSQKWYGTWEGDLQRAKPSAPLDIRNTINLLKVTILPDGTFEMVESGVSKSGRHRLGEDKAFLTIKKVLGRPIEQSGRGTQSQNLDLTLTWQEDGSILWNDPAGQDGHPVRLTLKSQPSE